jgi:hypothetical protein
MHCAVNVTESGLYKRLAVYTVEPNMNIAKLLGQTSECLFARLGGGGSGGLRSSHLVYIFCTVRT